MGIDPVPTVVDESHVNEDVLAMQVIVINKHVCFEILHSVGWLI